MACGRGSLSWSLMLVGIVYLVLTLASVSARESLEQEASSQNHGEEVEFNYLTRVSKPRRGLDYKHVWPEMRFGWKIVVSTLIGFLGAAFGSVGGVGGGGFFVPMLTLIIGFDQKSSTAISKCMITGGAAATVLYNLRQRHPTLELPLIDYDLAVLLQPMLVLGISIGVSLNVVLAEWMITILLIVVLLGTSTKSFFKGVDTWKKETAKQKNLLEASKSLQPKSSSSEGIEDKRMPGGTSNVTNEPKETKRKVVSILDNVRWKQLGVIVLVWTIILAVQIAKNSVRKCSVAYWLLDLSQIPVTVGISSYEAVKLYKGQRIIASKGEAATSWRVHKLVSYCVFGMVAGIIGGLLGLGGGFIMGPLFLEMGIPPQVSSATSTFIMTFSSSMSVVEYYLLKRFPVPYALYFAAVAIVSAIIGQHVVGKVIKALGRTSLIIFILSLTIFVSALSLGGVGIANMVKKIQHKESFRFQKMCS